MSERLLEDSSSLPANFFERQRFFHEMREARLQQLQADSVSPVGACLSWLARCVSRLHGLVHQLQADSLAPACLPAPVKAWPAGHPAFQCSSAAAAGCSSTSCLHEDPACNSALNRLPFWLVLSEQLCHTRPCPLGLQEGTACKAYLSFRHCGLPATAKG